MIIEQTALTLTFIGVGTAQENSILERLKESRGPLSYQEEATGSRSLTDESSWSNRSKEGSVERTEALEKEERATAS